MKAIRFHRHGGCEVLRYEEVAEPSLNSGEVRVGLKAAALNHLDIWVRQGMPGVSIPLPHIPGSDGAGIILECGKGVQDFRVGDRVVLSPGLTDENPPLCPEEWDSLHDSYHLLGLQVDGTYTEQIVVPERRTLKISEKLSFEAWASVPLVFLTAWHMLHTHAQLKQSDTVLIHAAGSGTGHAAIQIAKLAGARVVTTVGDDAKVAKAKALGADHIINYRQKDFAQEVLNFTEGRGADLIFDHIGVDTWKKNLICLAKKGRLVICGGTSGANVEVELRRLFMKQQSIMGAYMGGRGELKQVLQQVESGRLVPLVDKSFPLEEATQAHRYMAQRQFFGKIALSI